VVHFELQGGSILEFDHPASPIVSRFHQYTLDCPGRNNQTTSVFSQCNYMKFIFCGAIACKLLRLSNCDATKQHSAIFSAVKTGFRKLCFLLTNKPPHSNYSRCSLLTVQSCVAGLWWQKSDHQNAKMYVNLQQQHVFNHKGAPSFQLSSLCPR